MGFAPGRGNDRGEPLYETGRRQLDGRGPVRPGPLRLGRGRRAAPAGGRFSEARIEPATIARLGRVDRRWRRPSPPDSGSLRAISRGGGRPVGLAGGRFSEARIEPATIARLGRITREALDCCDASSPPELRPRPPPASPLLRVERHPQHPAREPGPSGQQPSALPGHGQHRGRTKATDAPAVPTGVASMSSGPSAAAATWSGVPNRISMATMKQPRRKGRWTIIRATASPGGQAVLASRPAAPGPARRTGLVGPARPERRR